MHHARVCHSNPCSLLSVFSGLFRCNISTEIRQYQPQMEFCHNDESKRKCPMEETYAILVTPLLIPPWSPLLILTMSRIMSMMKRCVRLVAAGTYADNAGSLCVSDDAGRRSCPPCTWMRVAPSRKERRRRVLGELVCARERPQSTVAQLPQILSSVKSSMESCSNIRCVSLSSLFSMSNSIKLVNVLSTSEETCRVCQKLGVIL